MKWRNFFKNEDDKNICNVSCAGRKTEIEQLEQALQKAIDKLLQEHTRTAFGEFKYTYNGVEKHGYVRRHNYDAFDNPNGYHFNMYVNIDPWEPQKEAMIYDNATFDEINAKIREPNMAKRLCDIILKWENKIMKFTEEVIIPNGTQQLLGDLPGFYYERQKDEVALFDYEHIGTLHIPDSLDVPNDKPNPFATYKQISFVSAAPVKCKPIRIDHVDNKSPHLYVEDGVIYSADKTRLMYCFKEKTEFTVPRTVRVIGSRAFCGQAKLERVEMHDDISEIGDAAFMGCSSLKSVHIPKAIKEISGLAFAGCISLTKIKLHDGITVLGQDAFLHCDALERIDLPDSIEKMDSFSCCFSLCEIRIPPRVKCVEGFTLCRSLKKVVLPDGVEEIKGYAFRFCEALEEINFPEGLKRIGTRAFYPTAIKKIVFPTTLEHIGCEAFYHCEALNSITFTSVVNDIEEATFACTSCWHISTPNEMKLDSSVFAQNKTLDKYGFWD